MAGRGRSPRASAASRCACGPRSSPPRSAATCEHGHRAAAVRRLRPAAHRRHRPRGQRGDGQDVHDRRASPPATSPRHPAGGDPPRDLHAHGHGRAARTRPRAARERRAGARPRAGAASRVDPDDEVCAAGRRAATTRSAQRRARLARARRRLRRRDDRHHARLLPGGARRPGDRRRRRARHATFVEDRATCSRRSSTTSTSAALRPDGRPLHRARGARDRPRRRRQPRGAASCRRPPTTRAPAMRAPTGRGVARGARAAQAAARGHDLRRPPHAPRRRAARPRPATFVAAAARALQGRPRRRVPGHRPDPVDIVRARSATATRRSSSSATPSRRSTPSAAPTSTPTSSAARDGGDAADTRHQLAQRPGRCSTPRRHVRRRPLGHTGSSTAASAAAAQRDGPAARRARRRGAAHPHRPPRDPRSGRDTEQGAASTRAREHVADDVAADIVRVVGRRRAGSRTGAVGQPGRHRGARAQATRSRRSSTTRSADVGVPAVIDGAGSVFEHARGTGLAGAAPGARAPDVDVRAPTPPRSRRSSAGPPSAWPRPATSEWEAVHRRLHGWARVLRARGVAALLRGDHPDARAARACPAPSTAASAPDRPAPRRPAAARAAMQRAPRHDRPGGLAAARIARPSGKVATRSAAGGWSPTPTPCRS